MKGTPEPNRLIRCFGEDWCHFGCYGMWVPYKNSRKQKASGRFMIRNKDGEFVSDRETWKSIDSWEYVIGQGEGG